MLYNVFALVKRREVISPLFWSSAHEAAWGDTHAPLFFSLPFILKRREVISPLFWSCVRWSPLYFEAAWGDLPFILKRREVISPLFWSCVRWSPLYFEAAWGDLHAHSFFLSPLFWSGQRLCLLPQFLSPYRIKNLKQRKDKMFISISDSELYIFHKAWTLRLLG